MGLFGKKEKRDMSDYQNVQPGAIPVATPVYRPEQDLEQQQQQPPPQTKAATTKTQKVAPTQVAIPIEATNVQKTTPSTAVVTTNNKTHLITDDPTLTRAPMMMRQCPNCHQESRTRIETFPTWQSFALAVVLFIVFWPICWVPLVVDTCKQTNHYCVLCGAHVGQIDPFKDCCMDRRG
mmetsp:Transcript_86638/g.129909  ORF Transcript_86638/g.129909 Transcript_86638/m.129909 type:complete len:179 (+) Transcript_86638:139-675(+)